jgi:Zn-finger nucleic acid-binding protein
MTDTLELLEPRPTPGSKCPECNGEGQIQIGETQWEWEYSSDCGRVWADQTEQERCMACNGSGEVPPDWDGLADCADALADALAERRTRQSVEAIMHRIVAALGFKATKMEEQ